MHLAEGKQTNCTTARGAGMTKIEVRCTKCKRKKPVSAYPAKAQERMTKYYHIKDDKFRCSACVEEAQLAAQVRLCHSCGIDKPVDAFQVEKKTRTDRPGEAKKQKYHENCTACEFPTCANCHWQRQRSEGPVKENQTGLWYHAQTEETVYFYAYFYNW